MEKKEIDVDCLKENKKEFVKNKLILKTQQRLKSDRHNVFTEKNNKIALSSDDDKRMPSIDSIEAYMHMEQSKDLICEEEKIKGKNTIKKYKNV